MDYFYERFRQPLEMDKYSTEILSKSYSDLSHQNEPRVDKLQNSYMAYDNKSETEVCSAGSGNCKRNISNATIAQLSAQIMNLPYNKFNESVPNEEKRCIYDYYDIFKKIREAYAACACKICNCITGTTVSSRKESCDCKPCKCRDCTLNHNLRTISANVQSGLSNCDRRDKEKSEIINTGCDCKPCNCIECSQHSCPLGSDYLVQNKMKELTRKMATKTPPCQDMPRNCNPTYDTLIGRNEFPNCKRATYLNDFYGVQKTKPCRGTAQDEVLSKQIEKSTNGSENYSTSLKNYHPITPYQSNSNKKCACSVCACITCERNGNALNCSLNKIRYGNKIRGNLGLTHSNVCECATCKCLVCSHMNQAILQPIASSKCKCDICSCIQCERGSEWYNRDCNCDQCYCENCKGGCDTFDDVFVIKKQLSIFRMMRGNALTHECDEYSQIMNCRATPDLKILKTPENTKYGKVYCVSNNNPDKSPGKTLRPVHSILKENRLDKEKTGKRAVRKDSDQNAIHGKRIQRKVTQVDNVTKKVTSRPNSRTSKSSMKNDSVSILNASLGKDVLVTSTGKTCLQSFYPGCRSTQTQLSQSSSSVFSYQNNGCCTHTISLPDTNIIKDYTKTSPKSYFQKQHDVYRFSEMKNDLNYTNADKFVRINENNDGKNNFAGNHFDTIEIYLTKCCNVDQTKQPKVHNKSTHSILWKARQFTHYLNETLQTYEKANSEFESISEKLKNLHYIMFNKANNNNNCEVCGSISKSQPVCTKRKIDKSFLKNYRSCNSITNHVAANEEIVDPNKSCKENVPIVKLFETVKSTEIRHLKKEIQPVEIVSSTIDALKNNQINKKVQIDNKTEIVTNIHNKLQGNVDKLGDLTKVRRPSIKSVRANNLHVSEDTIEEHDHASSEAELLRAERILNILKQNIVPDLFTEQVPSPRSTPMTEPKEHLTFNYHTKTLMRSTFPSLSFYYN